MIRAVLDANVFVSGILSGHGVPGRILKAWRDERFELVTSEPILEEVARALRYPKVSRRHGWPEKQLVCFIEDIRRLAILSPGRLTLLIIAEDPPDNRYLECALEAEADCIVSGDHHIVELGEYRGIEIFIPRAFLELLPKRPPDSQV
jgi:putative PIN family toxin of toxin-antitoxin system